MKGEFIFSPLILEPDEQLTSENKVKATFEVHANDLYNIIVQTSITPFHLKGLKDFGFEVRNAVIDLSDFANSPSTQFPVNYTNVYASNPTLWRGFYIQEFEVRLPSELQAKSGSPRTITANHLIIDDAGVSGIFTMNNVLSINEGDMNSWAFSVNQLGVQLLTNNLTSGFLKGEIGVPALDNAELKYSAYISKNKMTGNADYGFSVQPESEYSMNCFFANLNIYNTSSLFIERKFGKFKPTLVLNGKLSVNSPSYTLANLTFQDLTLTTQAPYITNGIFSLASSSGSEHKLANYPISISNISLGLYDSKPSIGATVSLNLADESTSGFSISTSIFVVSKIQTQSLTYYNVTTSEPPPLKTIFSFDRLKVNDVAFAMNTQPFKLNGLIGFLDNHPTYGKGFFGNITFELPGILPSAASVKAIFGRTTFRYWSVDAFVPFNLKIPGTQVTLVSFIGGASYHMGGSKSSSTLIQNVATNYSGSSSGQTYSPNEAIGVSVRAGVGFNYVRENLLNGDVIFSVTFNSSGGLNNVKLIGDAYMLVKRSERSSSTNVIKGNVNISYDHIGKIFDFNMNAGFLFDDIVSGSAYTKIHISPEKWYFWLGRPSSPCYVNVKYLGSASAYLMVGEQLEAMAPPPTQLSSLVNNNDLDQQRDISTINAGNGFAVGLAFSQYFDKSFGWDNFQIYGSGSVGAGFDMTMYKYADGTHCSGSSGQIGMRNWYLNGRLYAWLSINAGIRGEFLSKDFDITLVNGNAAVLLNGKLPKPTFVEGKIHIDATVLEVIHVGLDFNFEFGNDCNIVGG